MRTLSSINTTNFTDESDLEFYGTVNNDGTPHITMLNSMFFLDSDTLVWGEYCHGYSKQNQQIRRENSVLTLDAQRHTARLRVVWDHAELSGEMLDQFNRVPRFRYNNLWGYSPIHFMKVLHKTEDKPLGDYSGQRQASAVAAAKLFPGVAPEAISPLTRQYFSVADSFKVIGWVASDGVTELVAAPHCMLTDANRVVFSMDNATYNPIPEDVVVAIYAVQLSNMQSVLVKGKLQRTTIDGSLYGVVEIDAVYSPMMPKNDYIYPKESIQPIRKWDTALYEYNV